MLPVNPTHALAVARAEEVQRRAERAHLSSTQAPAPSPLSTALRTLSRHVRRPVAIPARPTPVSSAAVCCA